MTTAATHGYRTYVIIWIILLALTVTLILIGGSGLPTPVRALLLLAGSLTKATLILLYFMHLRYEKAGLIVVVIAGIAVTGLLMFSLPAFDGTQIFKHLTSR